MPWNTGIVPGDSREDCLRTDSGYDLIATGELDAIDEDGFTAIMVGTDMIVCFTRNVPESIIGAMVTAKIAPVWLYPDWGLPANSLEEEAKHYF